MRIFDDLTNYIFVEDKPERADILFVPGGSCPEPGERAADLWMQGFAPRVMPSGKVSEKTGRFPGSKTKAERYSGPYTTECEFLTDILLKNGVSPSAVIGETQAGFTKENALFSKILTDENHLKINKAIIVCKSFHARRTLMCYQFAFPSVEFLVCPADVYGISKSNWYQSEGGIQRVLGELTRCGNQFTDEFRAMCAVTKDSVLSGDSI